MKYILFIALILGISTFSANENKVWNYLRNQGLTKAGAAGLMGNLKAESGIRSVVYQDSDKGRMGWTDQQYVDKVNSGAYSEHSFVHDAIGFGLAQWTYYTRKQALLDMCKGKIGDLTCQLKYLMHEFNTDFKEILATLKTSTDVYACAIKVMVDFENPADQSESKKNFRYQLSKNYYDQFTGSGPAGGNTYSVAEGDTLYTIAQKFGTTVDILCQLNGIENPNMIYVGQVLFLP